MSIRLCLCGYRRTQLITIRLDWFKNNRKSLNRF